MYCGFSADVTIKLEESEDLVEEVEDISLDFASKEWGKSSDSFLFWAYFNNTGYKYFSYVLV